MIRAFAATVLAASALVVAAPGASAESEWQIVPPAKTRPITQLYEASALDAKLAWAVGVEAKGLSASGFPLIERWDGSAWTKASTRLGWQGELLTVAATSRTEAWATGSDAIRGQQHLIHWSGGVWRDTELPLQYVSRVAGGHGETWLLGTQDTARKLLRREAGKWVNVPMDGLEGFATYGMRIKGKNDVWLAGATKSPTGFPASGAAAHWNGSAWTVLKGSVSCMTGGFVDVTAASANDVWAVGGCRGVGTQAPVVPLLQHWDGTQWSSSPTGIQYGYLNSLAPDDEGRPLWASARESWPTPPQAESLYMRFDGQSWARVSGPSVKDEKVGSTYVSHVPGTKLTWSVGYVSYPEGVNGPRIERTSSSASSE